MKMLNNLLRLSSVIILGLGYIFSFTTSIGVAATENYNPNPEITVTPVQTTFVVEQTPIVGKTVSKSSVSPSVPNPKYYTPISGSLPQTGLLSHDMLYLFGIIVLIGVILSSGYLLDKRKQDKKENYL